MNLRYGEHIENILRMLDNEDPLTEEERAEHARLVHEQKWREQKAAADLFSEGDK